MLRGKSLGLAIIILLLGTLVSFPDFFGVPTVLAFLGIPNFLSKVPNCGDEQAVGTVQRLVVDMIAKRLPADVASDARPFLNPKLALISMTGKNSDTGAKMCSAQLEVGLSAEQTNLVTYLVEKERGYVADIAPLRQVWDRDKRAIAHSIEYVLSKPEGKGESGFLVSMQSQQFLSTTMAVEFVFLVERARRANSALVRPNVQGNKVPNAGSNSIPSTPKEKSEEHQFLPRPDGFLK